MQAKQAQSSAIYALVIVGVAFLFLFAKALLVPLAFALSLSLLLLPVVKRLEMFGMARTFAVILASGAACLVLLICTAVVYHQGLSVAQILVSDQGKVRERIAAMHSPASDTLTRLTTMVEDMSGEIVSHGAAMLSAQPVEVVQPRSAQLQALEKLAGSTLEPLGSVAVVIIFALYMLMNWEELRHRLLLLAGMSNISLMTRALDDAIARISEYLVMQLEVNAAYGLIFGFALFCLGVPNAALWGLIAGCLRIVPFVGTLIGMLLPLVLALAVSPSWVAPAGVFAVFLVIEFSTTNFIEPWLFSERTGISSLALLASAIFWSMLWGWPGLVLSTPLTVCLVVLGRHVPQFSFLHSLMATKATLSPPAHMYERLLAMDQEEAWAIAERYLNGHSLIKLYDNVLLPVLASSERDRHRGGLDASQERFVLLTLTELVARLAAYRNVAEDERSSTQILLEKLNKDSSNKSFFVCIPVDDKADELATHMLAQVLESTDSHTITLRPRALSEELLGEFAKSVETVIFLSALPPFAFAQTQALCQEIRAKLPANKLIVGFWHADADVAELHQELKSSGATFVFESLSASLQHSRIQRPTA